MPDRYRSLPWRLGALYWLGAGAWILTSDHLASRLLPDDLRAFAGFQTWKGLAFVLVTGLMLVMLLRHQMRRLEKFHHSQLKAEENLRESELRLRLASEAARVGLWEWNLKTGEVWFSPEWKRQIGCEDRELASHLDEWRRRVHPADLERVEKCVAAYVEKPWPNFDVQYRIQHRDGSYRWMQAQGSLVEDARGRRMLGSNIDITESRTGQQQILRLNRTLSVLNEINQLIVRERGAESLLASACGTAVEHGGFLMAWAGLANPGGALQLAAIAGATEETRRLVDSILADHGCAISEEALASGSASVCNDIATDPRCGAWREQALQRGFKSMASLPLKHDGRAAGTLNLYAGDGAFFDDQELSLLSRLAEDLSFALETERRKAQHRAAEERLSRQRAELIALTSAPHLDSADNRAALSRITEAAARTLSVERVGIWRHNRDRSQIECEDLFEASSGTHSSGAVLRAETAPEYFCALESSDIIAADDAATHPATREFATDYLAPNGIASMLDVPLRLGGHGVGVLCHEHAGSARHWTADEKTFAVALGNLVALAFERAERRQSESALRLSEERFRELAENIEDVFWVSTPDKMQLAYVSPAYEKIWGCSRESIYASARSWLDAIHPEDRERVLQASSTKQASGEYDEEYRILRADGSVRWIRDRAFPIRDHCGQVVRVVGVARDITNWRQLEEQFRQSQKLEAIGQLAGGVAHDFNNILAVILMHAEMIEYSESPAEAADCVVQIRTAAERAANLTRQLLLFSRRQVMQARDVDLNEVVTGLAKMLQRIIGEDIRLQINLHPRALPLHADPGMLDQVLLNLAVNARDAMPRGGALIITTSGREFAPSAEDLPPDAKAGRYVCVTVKDSGEGIRPEVLPRIFEPFFTTKGPGKGTGLGLATVFGIVKQHHGWITSASEPGHGATFEFFLPELPSEQVALLEAAPATEARGGTETILLVEDDPAVRAVTRATLARHGYQVIDAPSGEEAGSLWRQHGKPISLLLTDLVMPGISGQELARQLKSEKPGLKVVFTSGYSGELAGRELELGASEAFVAKPCAAAKLLQVVRQVLDGAGSAPPPSHAR